MEVCLGVLSAALRVFATTRLHSFATSTFTKTETIQHVGIRAKNNYQWKKEKTSGHIYISAMAVFAWKLWKQGVKTFGPSIFLKTDWDHAKNYIIRKLNSSSIKPERCLAVI